MSELLLPHGRSFVGSLQVVACLIPTGQFTRKESYKQREDKHDAAGVDLKPCPIKDLKDLVVQADLRSYEFVREVIKDAENNVIATINLLKACSDYGVDRFVYISSAAVYGNPKYVPIDEEHPKNPMSLMGLASLPENTTAGFSRTEFIL